MKLKMNINTEKISFVNNSESIFRKLFRPLSVDNRDSRMKTDESRTSKLSFSKFTNQQKKFSFKTKFLKELSVNAKKLNSTNIQLFSPSRRVKRKNDTLLISQQLCLLKINIRKKCLDGTVKSKNSIYQVLFFFLKLAVFIEDLEILVSLLQLLGLILFDLSYIKEAIFIFTKLVICIFNVD